MTLRFRRTLKIAPGLRINFNKNSISLSAGPRGAHYTVSSSGKRTVSAGIPGTGLYAYDSYNPRAAKRRAAATAKPEPQDIHSFAQATPMPTLFSKPAERAFSSFLTDIYNHEPAYTPHEIVEKAKALEVKYDSLMYPLNLLSFLHIVNEDEYQDKLIEMGSKLWAARETAFTNPLVVKYFKGIRPVVRVSEGISATEILNQQQFGFFWCEVLQAHEKYQDALTVLHEMDPTQLVAISMADIEISMKDYDAALETTSDITNEDDATVMLLILRGIAFREQGLYDASLECMKQALAKKDRAKEALHRAHFERSITYEKMKKIELARKDIELILVDDPTNEEVKERLKGLGTAEE